ncbi:MAG TPA: hypothetical protein VFU06_16480 [Longimicrobiales bacterium]|nr:hypothetical protein [Longimicrobiales bacterium]
MMSFRFLMPVLLATSVLACSDTSGPPGATDDELQFVLFDEEMFPLAERAGSVWAVKGEHRELVLRYMPDEPGEEGEEFLEFDIPGDALLRAPDGRRYAEGDSVLISVQVDDAGRFLFTFEPSGLEFDPDHLPELEVTYVRANPDLDGDGDEDEEDEETEQQLQLWQRERVNDPWRAIGSVRFEDLDEVEAKIRSFTGFALAS